jgi:hypothetical protein
MTKRHVLAAGVLLCATAFGGCSAGGAKPAAPTPDTAPVTVSKTAPDTQSKPTALVTDYYFTREITKADLEGRTLRELNLIRNTIFARAGNPFRKKWLRDYFSAQPWYKPADKTDESKLTALDRKNAEFVATFEAEIPRGELERRRKALADKPKDARTPEDLVELQLLARSLGKSSDVEGVEKTPLDTPEMLDKLLTVEQLNNFSRRDLRLLRNMVYARRGRVFKSPVLQDFFLRTEWYQADEAYSEAKLTDIDRRNIKIIAGVEQELGGAVSDKEMGAEWFGAA